MWKRTETTMLFNWCHQEDDSKLKKKKISFPQIWKPAELGRWLSTLFYFLKPCQLLHGEHYSVSQSSLTTDYSHTLSFCDLFNQELKKITVNLLHNSLHCIFVHIQASQIIHYKNLQVSFISQFFYIKFSKPEIIKSICNTSDTWPYWKMLYINLMAYNILN